MWRSEAGGMAGTGATTAGTADQSSSAVGAGPATGSGRRVPKLPFAMESATARSMAWISLWLMARYWGWKARQRRLKALRRPMVVVVKVKVVPRHSLL